MQQRDYNGITFDDTLDDGDACVEVKRRQLAHARRPKTSSFCTDGCVKLWSLCNGVTATPTPSTLSLQSHQLAHPKKTKTTDTKAPFQFMIVDRDLIRIHACEQDHRPIQPVDRHFTFSGARIKLLLLFKPISS